MTDLATLGNRIAAQLIPGWVVRWHAVTQEQINALVQGALAVCDPKPTREIADVYVVTPWPDGESLPETLWHELTHALLSPLTALVEQSGGAVMTEERIVERLGVLLNRLPMAARRAVVRRIEKEAPRLRARISARAPLARGGKQMDPEKIKALIAAIKEQNGDAALEIAEAMLVEAASGQAQPAGEPDGDEVAPPAEGREMGAAPAAAPPPMDGGKPAGDGSEGYDGRRARKETTVKDDHALRARKAADDIERMQKAMMPTAKAGLVMGLRARIGAALTPAAEKEIMGAGTFEDAEKLAAFAEKMAPAAPQRARSGVEHGAAPTDGVAPPPYSAADLVKEGIPQALADEIVETHKKNPQLAANNLQHARARLNGGANPFMPKPGANGAQKAS